MQDLLDKGYCVYDDIFYCSPELGIQLKKRNTDMVGVVKSNRLGLPKDVKNIKLSKNEFVAKIDKDGKLNK